MAALLGNNDRLFVEGPTAGTYHQIAGQRDLQLDRTASTIDIGDKNTAPYNRVAPGLIELRVTLDGVMDLPDTNGLARVHSRFKSQSPTNFQVRRAPFGTTDVVLAAEFNILDFSEGKGRNSEQTYRIVLGLNAAPTTDLLAPA